MRLLTALALVLAAAAPAAAAILPVNPDGSGAYPTIQAAIAAAAEGDSVLLADGVFSGPGNRDLLYLGKAITVAAGGGDPTLCIIDCGGSAVEFHRGVAFLDGEGPASVLAGITIRGGWADDPDDRGGGILIGYAASPRIERCVVTGCRADLGGALYADQYGAPTLVDCVFAGNTAGACGGVALNSEGRPQVIGCRFLENECSWGGALAFAGLATLGREDELTASLAASRLEQWQPLRTESGRSWPQLTVEGCLFDRNVSRDWEGAGIYFIGDQLVLHDTVIAHSWGDGWAAGGCALNFSALPDHPSQLEGVSFVENSCDEGDATAIQSRGGSLEIARSLFADRDYCEAIHCYDTDAVVQLTCCDLFTQPSGEWGGCTADQYGVNGNFDADPLLCGVTLGDFYLDVRSPCLPANNDCGLLVGALGEGCDLYGGSYYVRADGTGDFPTIQAALNAALVEEVILADGVFTGYGNTDLDFRGLPISLRSESGDPSRCLIDLDAAPAHDVAFNFDDNEGVDAEVVGIGIRNRAGGSAPVIICWGASPSFRDVLISNVSASYLGAVSLSTSHSSFTGCTFAGIGLGVVTPAVIALQYSSSPSFERCLIAGNAAASFSIAGSTCTLSCTDIHGNTGGDWIPAIAGQLGQAGNISQDPLFCAGENPAAPYTLNEGSPCAPAHSPCGLQIGAQGVGCFAAVHWVSGTIRTSGGLPLAGVSLGVPGQEVPTGPDGAFSIWVDHGAPLTLTPALAGYRFEPPTRYYAAVTTDLGDQDFTGIWLSLHRVPEDFATIQAAVNWAHAGDSVSVASGTFSGEGNNRINPQGKDLVYFGRAGAAATVIDGLGTRTLFNFWGGETRATLVQGFTLRGGEGTEGGAIHCYQASPTLADLIITNCTATQDGGGLFCAEASPLVRDVVFTGNSAVRYGGAIYTETNSAPHLEGVFVLGNSAGTGGGGLACIAANSPTIESSVFAGNTTQGSGGGCYFFNYGDAELRNVTLAGNHAQQSGSGLYSAIYATPALERCLVAFNTGGAGVEAGGSTGLPALLCCDVFGNPGGNYGGVLGDQTGLNGNFSADPLFCDAPGGDYSLAGGSPCLPAGNGCGVLVGALGLGCGGTGVAEPAPASLALAAQPNPFNPQVALRFGLATAAECRLEILSVAGRRLRTLGAGRREAGEQAFVWDGRDESGRALPSGIYLARLRAPGRLEQVKLVLLR